MRCRVFLGPLRLLALKNGARDPARACAPPSRFHYYYFKEIREGVALRRNLMIRNGSAGFSQAGAWERGVYPSDLINQGGFFYSVSNPIKYQKKIKWRVLHPFNPGGFLPNAGFRRVN